MTDGALERTEERLPLEPPESPGHLWRIGSASIFLVLLVLDFLALDDITTAGAWMPEILFLIASIPALVTFGYYTLRKPPRRRGLPPAEAEAALGPKTTEHRLQ
jgi:hypothetical protein